MGFLIVRSLFLHGIIFWHGVIAAIKAAIIVPSERSTSMSGTRKTGEGNSLSISRRLRGIWVRRDAFSWTHLPSQHKSHLHSFGNESRRHSGKPNAWFSFHTANRNNSENAVAPPTLAPPTKTTQAHNTTPRTSRIPHTPPNYFYRSETSVRSIYLNCKLYHLSNLFIYWNYFYWD